jgi:hypothetical protein
MGNMLGGNGSCHHFGEHGRKNKVVPLTYPKNIQCVFVSHLGTKTPKKMQTGKSATQHHKTATCGLKQGGSHKKISRYCVSSVLPQIFAAHKTQRAMNRWGEVTYAVVAKEALRNKCRIL